MPRNAPFGFARGIFNLSLPLTAGFGATAATNIMLSHVPGFAFTIEKVSLNCTIAGIGAAGSRVLNVRKGSASGTVVATKTVLVADCTLAVVINVPVTAANASYADTDAITVDLGGSGTVFTTFEANLIIQYRALPQRAV